jgi:hypothetical protein
MIVPTGKGGQQFFTDRARAIVTGLLIHLMVSETPARQTLGTLWGVAAPCRRAMGGFADGNGDQRQPSRQKHRQ